MVGGEREAELGLDGGELASVRPGAIGKRPETASSSAAVTRLPYRVSGDTSKGVRRSREASSGDSGGTTRPAPGRNLASGGMRPKFMLLHPGAAHAGRRAGRTGSHRRQRRQRHDSVAGHLAGLLVLFVPPLAGHRADPGGAERHRDARAPNWSARAGSGRPPPPWSPWCWPAGCAQPRSSAPSWLFYGGLWDCFVVQHGCDWLLAHVGGDALWLAAVLAGAPAYRNNRRVAGRGRRPAGSRTSTSGSWTPGAGGPRNASTSPATCTTSSRIRSAVVGVHLNVALDAFDAEPEEARARCGWPRMSAAGP